MRLLTLITVAVCGTSVARAEPVQVDPQVVISFRKDAAGYAPGAVVRPDGDLLVKDVPPAVSDADILFRIRFDRFTVEAEPFMVNRSDRNGPTVVGLRYEFRYAPFACADSAGLAFDAPWRNPCVEAGVAHRSAHNADDATYGSTFVNWLLVRLRLASAAHGRHGTWIEGDWYFSSLESPFVLTPETAIRAGDLERTSWRAAAYQRMRFSDADEAEAGVAVLASTAGPASGVIHARYLHAFQVTLGGGDGFSLQPSLGIQGDYARNFRKEKEIGVQTGRVQLVVALPFGK